MSFRPSRLALAAAIVVASFGPDGSGAEARTVEGFAVIVSSDVAESANVTPETAASIFRSRQTHWTDGTRVQPVNLPATDPLRQAFSQCLLGEPPDAMESYWREQYYHGVLPPHVVESEQAVVLFVAATPGAIGYVSSCPKTRGVRVVFTIGRMPDCARHVRSCTSLQDS